MSNARDTTSLLFERALADDGPEGAVAFGMLKERLRGKSARIIFDDDFSGDPLHRLLDDLKKRNATLTLERNRLRERIEDIAKRLRANARKITLDSERLESDIWKRPK